MAKPALLLLFFISGFLVGLGLYLVWESKAYAYLSDQPEGCGQCHIMQDHYRHYLSSNHRKVAQCNDCHSPFNYFGKLYTKAKNGFFHSFAFTTGIYQEPLQISRGNAEIAQISCLSCHANVFYMQNLKEKNCLLCHKGVGH